MSEPLGARFWAKVEKTDTCWNWIASTDRHGYGQFRLGTQTARAHRLSFMDLSGPIPEGMYLDHICHNRACVNPEHLRLATHKQNQENYKGVRSDSSSGVRGVHWYKSRSKWQAYVCHNGRQIKLGYFDRKEDAEAAAVAKRLELFTHNELDRANERKEVA